MKMMAVLTSLVMLPLDRIIGITSLGERHRYPREQALATSHEGVIAASKEIIVAPVAGLAVR